MWQTYFKHGTIQYGQVVQVPGMMDVVVVVLHHVLSSTGRESRTILIGVQVGTILNGHTVLQTGQYSPKLPFNNIVWNSGRFHAEVVLLKVVRSLGKLGQTILPHGLAEAEFMSKGLGMGLDEVGDASGTVPRSFGTEVL